MSEQSIEPYIVALQTALSADPTLSSLITSFGRRLKWWDEVQEQPALFVRHVHNEYKYDHDNLLNMSVDCEIWIYVKGGANPDAVPDTVLNQFEQAVRSIFAVDEGDGRYTLGGLVYWCRLEGRADFKPGDTDPQSVVVLPVKLLLWPD